MLPQPEDGINLEFELIGCELHDGPCQYIVSAQMLLESLRRQGIASSHNDGRLDMTLKLLERANVELRRLIRGLQPLQLDEIRWLTMVERLNDENAMDGGPKIEWCLDADFDGLPNHLKAPILRILQECLTNARRHSMTSNVLVGITQDERSVGIQVQDWGIGFDLENIQPKSYGLNGIRQRARLLNGTITIESHPGGGTCIVVDIPLRVQDTPADTNCPTT